MKKIVSFLLIIAMMVSVQMPARQVEASKKYTIKVNLGTNCTTIYKNGKAIKAMICSPSSETPTGTFYIPVKYRWHDMIGNCYAQYCSRITTGILFHSVWYYRRGDKSSMSVSAYNVMGHKASHGCVRLLCKDAKWIYDNCPVGTKITIFWGSKKNDPIKRPGFVRLNTSSRTSWDPTDPDPKNPLKHLVKRGKPSIKRAVKTIEYKKKVKKINLVKITASDGTKLTKKNAKITIKGKLNTKKLGKYKIKYIVKDKIGKKKTKTFTFKVVDTKKPSLKGVKDRSNVAMNEKVDLLKGVSAKSAAGNNLTSKIKVSVKKGSKSYSVKDGKITFTSAGKYTVKYSVKGNNKKTVSKSAKFTVKDYRVTLKLKKDSETITQGDEFDPYSLIEYVKSKDGKNIDIKSNVKISGNYDLSKAGEYEITFVATYKKLDYTKREAKAKIIVKEKVENN